MVENAGSSVHARLRVTPNPEFLRGFFSDGSTVEGGYHQRRTMQNHGATAGQADPRESDPRLDLLTEAVLRLTQQATQAPPTTGPTSRLTKLGPDDEVEAYLETFERVATQERWPEAQWAYIVTPFLTGPAQQASQDLSPGDAGRYPALKAAILAYYGHSLAVKALTFREWTFDVREPVRTQVARQCRLARRWLAEGEGPSPMDRVVVDNTVRQLPPDARRILAHQYPETVDDLVRQLENWQVARRLAADPRPTPRPTRRGTPTPLPRTGPFPTPRDPGEPERRSCYHCGQRGHLARDCPDRQDVPMPSAGTWPADNPACMLATCWAQGAKDSPTVPIKVMHRDTHALLDTGSAVTLMRADLAGGRPGTPMQVSCVHGDTRTYETCHVVVRTPQGVFVARAGIVPTLPVPFLIGRDCPIFARFWSPARGDRGERELRRPGGREGRRDHREARRPTTRGTTAGPGPALGATRRASARPTESGDEPDSGGEGPSAPGSPARSTGDPGRPGDGPRPDPDTVTASERGDDPAGPESSPLTELSDFAQAGGESSARPGQFATAQHRDDALRHAWGQVVAHDGQGRDSVGPVTYPHFCTQRGLLYRVDERGGETVQQLVVPRPYVSKVLFMAHTHLLGAHLGMDKTRERVVARFYWPGVRRDVERYCQECAECQRVAPRGGERSPLIPMPIIETPFERIALDIVGPLPKTSRGHRYLLVILDYATRYPEALPLRAATSKAVARELTLLFSRVGLPKEILTDQGSCFMSRVMKELLKLLQVAQLRTSVYHPQTDGLVERFNKTIKQMLKKCIAEDGKNWDQLLPHVLFAIREVPQASTGFSPFELLYGRRPRGILDLAKEAWESHPSPHRTTIEHVELFRDRMAKVWPIVRDHLTRAQQTQARSYNKGARVRTFQPGDKVLVLVPTSECKFLAKWQGPYEVVEAVGPVNYRVRQPGRRKPTQLYHINLLKQWRGSGDPPVPPPLALMARTPSPDVPMGTDLSPAQRQEVSELVLQNRDVFSDTPGRTTVIAHEIRTPPGVTVRIQPYRVPEARRHAIRTEVERMLDLGVIEESRSAWASPVVLVPKPDGTLRFCNDFRRLNEVSAFDSYPMPRVDELIERLGPARYLSTLDLTKGYWQVPLTPSSREKTAFATPGGLFQYTVLPFGVHGAPATFQRMMDRVLRPHCGYAAAYIDDIIVHSDSWDDHVGHLRAVLNGLRAAGLTANPAKCRLGRVETAYLGYRVGRGNVQPQEDKVAAIREWPQPQTKKQVRSFLGLVGYYQRFIPGYATLASPLNDLTRKALPDRIGWTEAARGAFEMLRGALCKEPLLVTPDFKLPFTLHTDASDVGLGGVLSQSRNGEEHPVTYISRKLLPHEKNYSTLEKEALAIKWAVTKLTYYLLGHQFTLVTDHAPLKWMATAKDTNARVTRWFLSLQPYSFTVEHRPGREHTNADALSRRDACGGWAPRTEGREQRGGVCGIPTRPRPLFGRVEAGIYRRWPVAGDKSRPPESPNWPNEQHLGRRHPGVKKGPPTDRRERRVGWKTGRRRGAERESVSRTADTYSIY